MSNLRAAALIVAGVVAAGVICSTPASAEASFGFFYSHLSPHGNWLVSGRYGNVWQPSTYQPGWNPYYDGHWEYTDVGQTWVSDYSWGAVPYHYGTWAWDASFGWVWVPGYTWAPAWVVFRSGPDFIGWAPVAPGFSVGVSVGLGSDDYDGEHFVFVPANQFFAPRVRAFAVPASRTKIIVNKTKIINNNIRIENNVVVNRGPSLTELRRVTRRPIHPVRLETVRGLGSEVKRDEIRVDAEKARHGLKASDPATTRTALSKETLDRGDRRGGKARRERERDESMGSSHDATVRRDLRRLEAPARAERDPSSHQEIKGSSARRMARESAGAGDEQAGRAAQRSTRSRDNTNASSRKSPGDVPAVDGSGNAPDQGKKGKPRSRKDEKQTNG